MSPLALHLGLAAALLAALLLRQGRASRFAIAAAGAIAAWLGYGEVGMMGAILPAIVALVGLAQSLGGVAADKRAKLSPEEEVLYAGPLAALGRADARRFLDQGLWMQGKPGDT